jgi:hypothetical protein
MVLFRITVEMVEMVVHFRLVLPALAVVVEAVVVG